MREKEKLKEGKFEEKPPKSPAIEWIFKDLISISKVIFCSLKSQFQF